MDTAIEVPDELPTDAELLHAAGVKWRPRSPEEFLAEAGRHLLIAEHQIRCAERLVGTSEQVESVNGVEYRVPAHGITPVAPTPEPDPIALLIEQAAQAPYPCEGVDSDAEV